VTIEVREVSDQYGDTVVRVAYDGAFDRTNLPDEITMTNYFSVRDGKDRHPHGYLRLTEPP